MTTPTKPQLYRFKVRHIPIKVLINDYAVTETEPVELVAESVRRIDVVSSVGGADFIRLVLMERVDG